jgi:23S rRNA U2552 (ribose-2'-O)-methylase RlmE/FtsJ
MFVQDLCLAALQFASDTLRTGGHFVCKFYQGSEDKDLELKLKKMFGKVHREKPESSRHVGSLFTNAYCRLSSSNAEQLPRSRKRLIL